MRKFRTFIVVLLCFACISMCACSTVYYTNLPSGVEDGVGDTPTDPSDKTPSDPSEKPSDPQTPVQPPKEEDPPEEQPEYATPVVRIEVEGRQEIVSKETYLPATVTLTDGTGTVKLDGVSAGVRGRGNYTWTLDKKGYRIKFNKKQEMLSTYKCKSWALLPNHTDKTLLRNYYAFQTARAMDGLDWATDAKLIEVYLNGEYLGVYLLCDQTQVDANRVNVEEGSESVDTGFLIERDRYAMEDPTLVEGRDYFTIPEDYFYWPNDDLISGPLPYVLKSPEYPDEKDYTTAEDFKHAVNVYTAQFNYIKDYVTQAFTAAQQADFSTFKALCDENSFVDYFLLDQVLGNWEIDRYSSFYLHKDKGGKLVAGPVWDFDTAGGYADPDPGHNLRYNNNWFISLGHYNTEFRKLYADRMQKHTSVFKAEANKLAGVAQKNRAAIDRNNEKWPVSERVHPMTDTMAALKTYDAQLDYFVNFVTRRTDYLNTRLAAWH